jgi:predicted ATPase/DNA-binding SARP family transcriptional activator
MPTLSVTLFGVPRIERDGAAVTVKRRKSLALLAYLSVTRQPHGRDALATLLWPDAAAERARAGLRRTLVDLNAALGKGWLDADGDQVALRADVGMQVDVERFHAALAQVAVHSHPPHHLCDACLAHLAEAADLYTADFLVGFTLEDAAGFDDWQTFQSESLRLELAGVLEKLAQGLAGRQQWEAAISHARRWLALDPLNEPAHRLLMQLHAWASDRAAAVRQYQECVRVMQEELGIEPETETVALVEAIRCTAAGLPSAPLLPGSPAPVHNLLSDPTPFVGREPELAQVAERLADPACRLLTVIGPGGMGKTRLAIQAARRQTDVFAHGVWFVDLAPVSAADFLAAAIVRALPISASGADAQTQLTAFLREKHLLLVLDNFEHLVEGANLLPNLLAGAPRVKLLVTSRVRLNLREEWLAPLEGLETPEDLVREGAKEPHSSADEEHEARSGLSEPSRFVGFASLRDFAFQPATLEHYSATALFLACVRRLRPDFQPNDEDARQIVRICRLLDGTPLAIELAAAWHRSLPLHEIARELERGLGLLAAKTRDAPERQRSMTATFDYSWGLLSPHERRILRQASVFRGGFTREAAGGIAGVMFSDLDSLVDASWISLRASGRYDLHELTRQYCAAKLESEHAVETGETADQARDRHAAYYRTLLLAQQGEFWRRPDAFAEVGADYPNLLAAWHWFVAQDDIESVRTMIPGLFWKPADGAGRGRPFKSLLEICVLRNEEGKARGGRDPIRSSERALVQATALTTLLDVVSEVAESVSWESWQAWAEKAMFLLAQGHANDERWLEARWLLRYRVAVGNFNWGKYAESADQLRTLLRELDEGRFRPWPYTDEARCYWQIEASLWLGFDVLFLGRYEETQRLAERSIVRAEQIGSQLLKAEGLGALTMALVYLGDCRKADKSVREQLRIYRLHRNPGLVAQCLWRMAQALAGAGDYLRARACLRRVVALGGGNPAHVMPTLHHLGCVELALGNLAQARRFYQEMMTICEGWDFQYGMAAALTGLARVALAKGELAEAREHLLRALGTPPHTRAIQHTIETIAAVVELQQAEGQWEKATEWCAALLSWPATPNYAPETTQHLRTELEGRLRQLEAQLLPEVFAAAVARGRARQIDEVVAELVGG